MIKSDFTAIILYLLPLISTQKVNMRTKSIFFETLVQLHLLHSGYIVLI